MPSWKKVVASGSDASFSSLTVDTFVSASSFNGTFTGSLEGTASQAISSSFALTASYALNGGSGQGFPFSGSAQITGSLGVTGSFSVNGNTGQTVFASNADTLVISGSLIVTGSSQVTGSLNVRGGITGSLYGTSSWAENSVSSSYALTASYALNGGGGGVSAIYILDEGVVQGTASYFDFTGAGVTATVNNQTASIYIPGGGGGSNTNSQNAILSQTSPAVTWSFTHNLSTLYPVFTIYDNEDNVIIPQKIHAETTASAFIYFSSARTGTAVASKGGDVVSASFAATASLAYNALTASYVLPLKQTVVVTGSLNVSGSTTQIGNNQLLGNTSLSGSVIISGSVAAKADLYLGGILRLDPAEDPGPSNLTASFLFTSASNTDTGFDLYYRQNTNQVKFKWLEGGISTGLLYGGVITYSGTTIFVTSGSAIINSVNATTSSEISPQFTYVTWAPYTASAAYLTSSQNTYIYVDSVGTIHQQTNYFTETQYQQAVPLGRVTHANYTAITGVGSNIQTSYDNDQQQNEFIRSFGPMKVNGLTVTGQAGSLRYSVGSGTSFNLGGFYPQDPNFPSQYTSTLAPTASIARAYRSGSGIYLDNNAGSFYTVVDPTKYDDGSGTLQNTGTGNWTIQRVFYNPVSKRNTVYYGQSRYTTLLNALQYLATDPFEEGEFTAKSLVFVAYLILKGNTSDLTDTENRIIQAGLFRNTAGGSSGAGVVPTYLYDLADVSITGATNGQALIYNSGTWENGTPILASTASYVVTAQTASYVENAVSSSYAYTASSAVSSSYAFTASSAINASASLTSVSASYALTASYALNGGGGGLSALFIADEGTTQGTASYINFTGAGVTATVSAGTASINITGGGSSGTSGLSTTFTQSVAAETWSFVHNLNTRYPLIQVYDTTYNQVTPQYVSSSTADTVIIGFGVPVAGYAVASNGGTLYVTGSNVILDQAVAATTWSFNHNLNTQYPIFQVFDSTNEVVVPERIVATDATSSLIYFPSPVAGKAVASVGGISGSMGSGVGFPFSGSAVITGSFLVSQSFVDFSNTTGVTGSFSGSLYGTASYATFALSCSFAPGFTTNFTQSVAATTWSFTHNLNTVTPIVQVYDLTNSQIIPNQIVGMNNSTVEVRFDYAQAGYAVASNGGGLYVTGSTSTLVQTAANVTWSFTHNLNNKYNTYEVYDDSDVVIIPSGIKALTNNTAEIYFSGPQTGRVVGQFSGINGAPNATTASYALTATTASYAATASYLNPVTSGYVVLTQVSQSLNFVDDAAAEAGGVPLGGIYRNGNFILIRLS